MKMRSRKDKTYYMVLALFLLFSCRKENKVELVRMPDLIGYQEILYGPVHSVKLLIYNTTRKGDSLVKEDRLKERTDLDLSTGSEALVTFNKAGLCVQIVGYRYGTSTIGGGVTFDYDDQGRLLKKKFFSGYPFGIHNCKRVYEYKYKRLEDDEVTIETKYVSIYYEPAKGPVLSEQVRELDSKTETFYNKYGDTEKYYSTHYELDDDDPEHKRSVVSYSDTIIYKLSYKKGILISRDDANFHYDDKGRRYATERYNGKRVTYMYPNGQPKAYDCSGGSYEDPLGCTHYFNEEGYFLESARAKAEYSHKDSYGNWTRMVIGHKSPGTILIGEREITYYNQEN